MRDSTVMITGITHQYAHIRWEHMAKPSWFFFDAWRLDGGVVERSGLKLLLPRNPLQFLKRRSLVRPAALLSAYISWPPSPAEASWDRPVVTVRSLAKARHDAELLALHHDMLHPPTRYDFPFGTFVRDVRVQQLHAEGQWLGRPVNLTMNGEFGADIDGQAAFLGVILANQGWWQSAMQQALIDYLYPNWAENWRDPDEPVLAPDAFVSRCALKTIQIWAAGDAEFWLDDGHLFAGHAIKLDATAAGFIGGGIEG